MARTTPIIAAFTGGEVTKKTDGRLDLEGYYRSCEKILNMIPTILGPAQKRTGTRFISEVKTSANFTRLIEFQYSAGDNYMLEFGEYYIRFYTQGGVLMDGGSPYEISSPYESADLDSIQYVQMADAMYLVHSLYPVYKLIRNSATNWSLAEVNFVWGPFLSQNIEETYTLAASAVSGTGITLTAAGSGFTPFVSDHVGSLWKLVDDYTISGEMDAVDETVGTMELDAGDSMIISLSGTWVATIELQRSYDNGSTWLTYLSFTSNTTMEIANLEDRVKYRWKMIARTSGIATGRLTIRDYEGYVKITAVTDSTHATADVIETLASTDATWKWSEGAFSDYRGYPAAIRFYEQRLLLAGTAYRPATIWASEVDDYESFKYGITDANAYIYTLAAAEVNRVRWMNDSKVLFIGTGGDEWKFGFADEPTTSTNVDAKRETSHGCAAIRSILIQNSVIFIEAGGRALRAITYNFGEDAYMADRFSEHAEHLFESAVYDVAFQEQPDPIIWMIRNDGYLLSCTFHRREKIAAFAQHYMGGAAESVGVIRGSDRDEVWVIVRRTINGATKRYVEQVQTHAWQYLEDAFYIDSGLSYDGWNDVTGDTLELSGGPPWTEGSTLTMKAFGSHTPFSAGSVGDYYKLKSGSDSVRVEVTVYTSSTEVSVKPKADVPSSLQGSGSGPGVSTWALMAETLSGMSHLEGQAIKILTDGAIHAPRTVSSGSFSLDWPAAKVHAGLGYQGLLKTKPFDFITQAGATIGKEKAIFEVVVRLYKSLNCKIGYDENNLDEIYFRTTKTPLGSPPELFTGDKKLPMKNRANNTGQVVIANDDPLPFSVLAIAPTEYFSQL